MRKFLTTFLLILVLALVTLGIISFGRGYRFDPGKKAISPTGLLVATSDPNGAQIFLDGKLKSATNTTLALPPGWYQVKIVKEGFLPWEKKMKIQGELVSETRTTLFPSTPALTPLTTSGVIAPTLSPDGIKIVYAVPSTSAKAGLWVLNLTSSPLGFSRDPELLVASTPALDFAAGTFLWSPSSKQILVTIGSGHYLVTPEGQREPLFLNQVALENQMTIWQQEKNEKDLENLSILPTEFAKIATSSAKNLEISPDETKVFYQATASATLPPILANPPIATNPTPEERDLKAGGFYTYDLKEDKNFKVQPVSGASLYWYPSSRHLVEVTSDKISILEYDGTNRVTVYNGPFEKFVAVLPNGNKLLFTTSYNRPVTSQASDTANLYSINLR